MLGPQDTPTQEDISQTESRSAQPTNQQSLVESAENFKVLQIAKELGMEDLSKIDQESDKLKSLIEWARNNGAEDDIDIVYQIKKLSNRIGAPVLGENKMTKLARYVYLENERNAIEEKMEKVAS
jgi:hypothetical protein